MEHSKDNGFTDIEKMAGELLHNASGNGVVSPSPSASSALYRNGVVASATDIPLDSKDAINSDHEDTSHGIDQGGRVKCCCHVKMIYLLLFAMMVSVWGLLSLPIVFYHIQVREYS